MKSLIHPLIRLMALCLALTLGSLGLMAQEAGKAPKKRKLSKEVQRVETLLDYLKTRPGYEVLDTELHRSKGQFPSSLVALKSAYIYAARMQPFVAIDSLIRPEDYISRQTLESYKRSTLPPKPTIIGEPFDGYVAVHHYKAIAEGDTLALPNTLVYYVDKELTTLVDMSEWFGFDYKEVSAHYERFLLEAQRPEVNRTIDDEDLIIYDKEDEAVESDATKGGEALELVDEPADFPGGMEALSKFLGQNIQYPQMAQEMGVEGRVVLQFIVETDGQVSSVRIVRSVENSLDLEALRVLLTSPKWQPAVHQGKPVRSRFTLPVQFRLQ
ncbi:MAG: energy transducer TonB [Porphyromonas sp.]|nr:energy transducer TonB [Porphyromonas sp.]